MSVPNSSTSRPHRQTLNNTDVQDMHNTRDFTTFKLNNSKCMNCKRLSAQAMRKVFSNFNANEFIYKHHLHVLKAFFLNIFTLLHPFKLLRRYLFSVKSTDTVSSGNEKYLPCSISLAFRNTKSHGTKSGK